MAFDAILFDFDGVLIDSEPVHWACWSEVLKPLGVILDWEYYRDHCIGIDDKEMLKVMAGRAEPPRDWERLWQEYPAKRDLFRERMLAAPPFPEGLGALLDKLRGKYKLAVVTSSARSEIEPLLVAGGFRDYFDTMVCAKEAGAHKPAPDPYLLAARQLSATRPLVVEDSEAGMASARAAGFEFVQIRRVADVPALVAARLGIIDANALGE